MAPDFIFKILGDRWLRTIVMLVILAALAQQISLVIWRFVPEPEFALNHPTTVVTPAGASQSAGADFHQQAKAIGNAYLFGKAEVTKKAEVVVEAPQTRLNYKLRGIYFSPNENLSSAIVETRPNDSKHYRLGDELADKIVLAQIEEDHILIDRYGKLERLDLEKPVAPTGASKVASSPAAGGKPHQTALLRSYKRRYQSNPMALATRFQAIPVQQDGKNIGFKLKALRGEGLLKKLDFQPDDVFTSVNGASLGNPFEALDALKSLTTAESVSVTFIRNGTEQTADFRI